MGTRTTIGIALATFVLIASAYGDAVFTLGNNPQNIEQSVLFQADPSGNVIDGFTKTSKTLVQFSSATDTLKGVSKGQGQGNVEALDKLINDITITVPGHIFLDAIVSPFKPDKGNDLLVTVTMSDGLVFTKLYGDKNGNNFLTITTNKGGMISSVTIDSKSGFQGLEHLSISGISTPEPSSMLLLGTGVLTLAQALRRKML